MRCRDCGMVEHANAFDQMFQSCTELESCAYRRGIRVRAYGLKVGDARASDFWKAPRKLIRY
jgi:hypothetical protein